MVEVVYVCEDTLYVVELFVEVWFDEDSFDKVNASVNAIPTTVKENDKATIKIFNKKIISVSSKDEIFSKISSHSYL